jgi:hypothetical protein
MFQPFGVQPVAAANTMLRGPHGFADVVLVRVWAGTANGPKGSIERSTGSSLVIRMRRIVDQTVSIRARGLPAQAMLHSASLDSSGVST